MKVAIASDGAFPSVRGGMARHTSSLALHLSRCGVSVDVFHPGPPCFSNFPLIGERIVPWPRYRFKGHYLLENWEYSKRVAKAMMDDGTYAVCYAQGLSFWAGSGKSEVPTLLNPHGLEFLQMTGWDRLTLFPTRQAFRSAIARAEGVVSLGGRLTALLKEQCDVPEERLHIIPNAVDLDYLDHLANSPVELAENRFVFAGRLAFNKGLDELVAAFESLGPSGVELVIVGDGPRKEELRRRISSPSIRLAGWLGDKELIALLRTATAFVFPTWGEGMPTAILEAMACRLPIIATDVSAIPELVDDSNGILIEPYRWQSIQTAVLALTSRDVSARRNLGLMSRMKVEARFTWPTVAEATADVLRGIADGRVLP